MTAIRATFHKILPVPSRGQYQFVFEIPEEEAQHALDALGGLPVAGVTRWVGIAMLMSEGDQSAAHSADAGTATQPQGLGTSDAPSEAVADGAPKPRRRFSEMSRAQQAGILCQDVKFQRWMCAKAGWQLAVGVHWDADDAAEAVRLHCKVKSRSDLDNYKEFPAAAGKWDVLVTAYHAETGQMAEQR